MIDGSVLTEEVFFAVLDEFQFLYFANVSFAAKMAPTTLPTLQVT